MRVAKENLRPDGGWTTNGYAKQIDLVASRKDASKKDGVERVKYGMAKKKFLKQFIEPGVPTVLTGVTDSWKQPAGEGWSPESLCERYGRCIAGCLRCM